MWQSAVGYRVIDEEFGIQTGLEGLDFYEPVFFACSTVADPLMAARHVVC